MSCRKDNFLINKIAQRTNVARWAILFIKKFYIIQNGQVFDLYHYIFHHDFYNILQLFS
jgi:hypothetical protein